MKRRKLPPLKSLEKKLDRVFSEYIRRRDADEGGTAVCVTCGKLYFWRDIQAGHWVKRQHRALRWDERNVYPQCAAENLYKNGAMDEMAAHIIRKHGAETIDELLRLKKTSVKHTRADLETLIAETEKKIAALPAIHS